MLYYRHGRGNQNNNNKWEDLKMKKNKHGFWMDAGFNFIDCACSFCFLNDNNSPVFKDCNGNYAELKGRNGHKLFFNNSEDFKTWYENKINS